MLKKTTTRKDRENDSTCNPIGGALNASSAGIPYDVEHEQGSKTPKGLPFSWALQTAS